MKDHKKVAMGKKSRKDGAAFELKVRKWLEENGFFVDRWTNNVRDGEIRPARGNRFGSRTLGFPDFVAFDLEGFLILVECKTNGILSKDEKEKIKFLEERGFTCYVAYKGDDGKSVEFKERPRLRGEKA